MRARRRIQKKIQEKIAHLKRRGKISQNTVETLKDNIKDTLRKKSPAEVGRIISDLVDLSKT